MFGEDSNGGHYCLVISSEREMQSGVGMFHMCLHDAFLGKALCRLPCAVLLLIIHWLPLLLLCCIDWALCFQVCSYMHVSCCFAHELAYFYCICLRSIAFKVRLYSYHGNTFIVCNLHHQILSTCRLSALEELSGMEVLCSDKTGTLTLNK